MQKLWKEQEVLNPPRLAAFKAAQGQRGSLLQRLICVYKIKLCLDKQVCNGRSSSKCYGYVTEHGMLQQPCVDTQSPSKDVGHLYDTLLIFALKPNVMRAW